MLTFIVYLSDNTWLLERAYTADIMVRCVYFFTYHCSPASPYSTLYNLLSTNGTFKSRHPFHCRLMSADSTSKNFTQVETTQEKIISLELTTSPSSETAPSDLAGVGLGEGETEGEHSLQPDIVQVVNPLLDGGAGRVTAIPVGPAQRLTTFSEHQ